MEDFDVLGAKSLFFLSTLLRILRQSIGSFICFALTLINLKVIIRKFLNLADLSRTQTLCIYESTKIVVLDKNKDVMFATF